LATWITRDCPPHSTACPIREHDLHDGPHCDTSRYTANPPPFPSPCRLAGAWVEEWVGSLPGRHERKGQPTAARARDASTSAPRRALLLLRGVLASPGVFMESCRRAVSKTSFMLHLGNRSDSVFPWPFYTHLYPYPYTHHTTQTGASLFRSTMSAKTVSPCPCPLPCLDSRALQARMMTKERDGGIGETAKTGGVVESGLSVRWWCVCALSLCLIPSMPA